MNMTLLTIPIVGLVIVALSVWFYLRSFKEHEVKPKLTRNYRIWLQYACWCIQFWMSTHQPYLPVWLRRRLLSPFPQDRWHVSQQQYKFWQDHIPNFSGKLKPIPWPIGIAAEGPFVAPWNRLTRRFRNHTGGRSHRCEFTDPQHGALYGHNEGAFMDSLFEQFLANIDGEE